MSWTEHKFNKLLFFRQMGEWYFKDQCINKDVSDLIRGSNEVTGGVLVNQCCSKETTFSCYPFPFKTSHQKYNVQKIAQKLTKRRARSFGIKRNRKNNRPASSIFSPYFTQCIICEMTENVGELDLMRLRRATIVSWSLYLKILPQ